MSVPARRAPEPQRDRRATRVTARAPVRVGVDLTLVRDVSDALESFGSRYAARVFTAHELASSRLGGGLSPDSLAARFAAKEAVLKVLEPSDTKPQWREIEVRRVPSGACRIRLHRRAAALAKASSLGPMSVSLSHEAGLAVAVVVAMCGTTDTQGRDLATELRARDHHEHTSAHRRTGMTIADNYATRIRNVLSAHAKLPVDVASLDDDDDLFQAGMTSHASVNVMLALEDDFDLEFPEAMLNKRTFASIGALRRALVELTTAAEVPA